jgi:hypothetical protein
MPLVPRPTASGLFTRAHCAIRTTKRHVSRAKLPLRPPPLVRVLTVARSWLMPKVSGQGSAALDVRICSVRRATVRGAREPVRAGSASPVVSHSRPKLRRGCAARKNVGSERATGSLANGRRRAGCRELRTRASVAAPRSRRSDAAIRSTARQAAGWPITRTRGVSALRTTCVSTSTASRRNSLSRCSMSRMAAVRSVAAMIGRASIRGRRASITVTTRRGSVASCADRAIRVSACSATTPPGWRLQPRICADSWMTSSPERR